MANKFDNLTATERGSAPTTPATSDWKLYFKSDGLYVVDDAGTETGPLGTGTGSGTTVKTASTSLTNHTPSNTSMEQWGTEEASVAQVDAPSSAVVVAWLSGSMGTSGSASGTERGEYRLEVSLDGGSTWATMGDAGVITTIPSTGAGTRTPVAATGRATGSPTGDVQVRAMCRDADTSGTTIFADGVITMMVHS